MDMRRFHRWFGSIAGIFMIFIGTTGIALQLDLFLTGNSPVPAEGPPPTRVVVPSNEQLAQQLAQAMKTIRAARPDFHFTQVSLQLGPGPARTVAGGMGPFAPSLSVDAKTGKLLPPPPPRKEGYHVVLQDLHAGYIMGLPGRLLSIALGFSLIVLGVTGLAVYWDLFTRRGKRGKRAVFWK